MAKSPPELPALRSDKLLDRMSEGGLADNNNNNNNYNADNAEAYIYPGFALSTSWAF